MTYLEARKRPGMKGIRVASGIGAAVVLIFAALQFWMPHFLPSLFTTVARPFWRAQFSLMNGSMQSPEYLLKENADLKQQVADLEVREQTVQATLDENVELKLLLGRASTTPHILAAVLERPPYSPYDQLIIDAGADHGFAVGNRVYAAGGVLIGQISDVLGQTSKVRLYSSPGNTLQVTVGPDHIPTTASGRGGGQYEADLPRDVKVAEGDYVQAPLFNDSTFGIVTAVLSDPTRPFEKILFAPPVNMFQLRWVMVEGR
jgi:cell shape-determining protein MreC